jgi:hypothetical protein
LAVIVVPPFYELPVWNTAGRNPLG